MIAGIAGPIMVRSSATRKIEMYKESIMIAVFAGEGYVGTTSALRSGVGSSSIGDMGDSGGDGAGMLILKVPGVVVPDLCFQGWREIAESAFLFVLFRHVDVGWEYGRCFCGSRASKTSATKSWDFDSSCENVAREYSETLSTESLEAEIAPLEWRRTRSMSWGSRGSHEKEG